MIFASDNWAGAHPDIAAALVEPCLAASRRPMATSDLDQAVDATLQRDLRARGRGVLRRHRHGGQFAVAGRVRQARRRLLLPPRGACHRGRMRRAGISSPAARGCAPSTARSARSTRQRSKRAIGRFVPDFVHAGRPTAVTITQATEVGTVYALDEIAAISAIAKTHGLPLHMDGARFANALVALDTTPAEMTWKRGVDILSFGGTKNGCWCAEAVDPVRPRPGRRIRLHPQARGPAVLQVALHRRAVRRLFRGRICGWRPPRHANAMAARLAAADRAPRRRCAWPGSRRPTRSSPS